jgi:hypothetical protein
MSVYDELQEIQQKAGEQQDKLSNVSDRLEDARQILISLNVGDEIGEVMEEIKEVIKVIEDAQADIY